MSILALPTELVEEILISTAEEGFPLAISAFAQTCKATRSTVYQTDDNHLWRSVFLTTFDDPRGSGGGPGWTACMESAGADADEFEWGTHFRRRIWAANHFRRHVGALPSNPQHADDVDVLQNVRVFDSLLSVIKTALPCPPTIVLSFPTPPDAADPPTVPASCYPTFPPLPHALSNISPTGGPTTSGRSFGAALRAKNTVWVESLLANGYPSRISALFSGDRWHGGLMGQELPEHEFREMQLAGHLIACTGFVPAPSPQKPSPSPASPTSSPAASTDSATPPSSSSAEDEADAEDDHMSKERQLKRARRLARKRVYNMHYLSSARHWGPYLRVPSNREVGAADGEDFLQHILALFQVQPGPPPQHGEADEDDEDDQATLGDNDDGDDDDDDDDPNYDPEKDDTHVAGEESETSTAGGVDEDEEEQVEPGTPPPPTQLRADWAYLAAVRVVVEANLRESVGSGHDLRGLFSLDGLRPGSAPWDAAWYKQHSDADAITKAASVLKGKGKHKEDAEVTGWDWAGVTGIWKRCVCWMDYRHLICMSHPYQRSGEFEDPRLQEAVRIITMRLRVKSYSPADNPDFAHLPNIHVEGETLGSLPGPPRQMEGTVSVIADGSVRWQLYSSVEGARSYEWVSEGVQLGGVASAMGVLGMWTGAQHERMDPLGECPVWTTCFFLIYACLRAFVGMESGLRASSRPVLLLCTRLCIDMLIHRVICTYEVRLLRISPSATLLLEPAFQQYHACLYALEHTFDAWLVLQQDFIKPSNVAENASRRRVLFQVGRSGVWQNTRRRATKLAVEDTIEVPTPDRE
ncbi:uncharacterized protein BXZ73DRAFT_44464 [Epithele typhae]|uniref:uncharacterized protein n=1 Tax=Epithele typhae TaxID=378194 RepID=UPI0020085715|nr:uncharacterized protein BXZ73DRAFT_44464 [Epithele typhae]KAH9938773.1 hypothetical protein BXZ73DRAFT_44464 [Epithele typhae]